LPPQSVTELPRLPQRAADAHKGDVGRILIIGGSLDDQVMIGAPALAANSALRSGAGLIKIVAPANVLPHILTLAPCATGRVLESPDADLARMAIDFGADVVAVGPGMGNAISPPALTTLFEGFSGTLLIDADALNLLATMGKWQAKWPHNVVLTPHPGEMRRLIAGYGMDVNVSNRQRCAAAFAQETGTVVLLKGAGTVVSDPQRVYVNESGNAGMATAGTGDVLTGVIAALMGQKMEAFEAAVLGAHVHGLAGDSAAEEMGRISLIATDLIDFLPEAFSDISHEGPLWDEST